MKVKATSYFTPKTFVFLLWNIIIVESMSLLRSCFRKTLMSNTNFWSWHVQCFIDGSQYNVWDLFLIPTRKNDKVWGMFPFIITEEQIYKKTRNETSLLVCFSYNFWLFQDWNQKHHHSLFCREENNCSVLFWSEVTTAQVHFFTLTRNGKFGSTVISHCYVKYVPEVVAKGQTWGSARGSDAV